jgi:YaiO family outer membrane protein
MAYLRHFSIAAVLLAAVHTIASAAEPLVGVHATGWQNSEAADLSVIREKGAVGINWSGAVPASNAVQPVKRVGIGLGFSNDAFVNGFTSWDGAYLPTFDRVAERNTAYGPSRETLGLIDRNVLSAACCQRSETLASPQRQASAGTAVPASPTISIFAIMRKKKWDIDLKDGWKLQAGGLSREYSQTLQTRVGFLKIERFWESFRTSYSFQLERANSLNLAPSQVLLFDYLYAPSDSIGVSYSTGREFADFGTLGTLNTEVRSAGIRGQHWFKKDWAFTYQAGHSDHGSLPAYDQVRLGLQRGF